MKRKVTKKQWILTGAALAVAAAVGIGVLASGKSSSATVNVYPFRNVGMTEFWGDNQESYGPVSSDNIQTVFLSDTQTVTEILVKAGDTVKKGDVLMTFDTTLSDLALERKRLDVEQLKLQLGGPVGEVAPLVDALLQKRNGLHGAGVNAAAVVCGVQQHTVGLTLSAAQIALHLDAALGQDVTGLNGDHAAHTGKVHPIVGLFVALEPAGQHQELVDGLGHGETSRSSCDKGK